MTNLTFHKSESGIELVIDTYTGEAFTTQTGYARMAGLNQSTVNRRVNTYAKQGIKKAEMLTPQGLRPMHLIPADVAFQWLIKDNPELAFEMGRAGATVFFYKLAGLIVSAEPPKAPEPVAEPTLSQVLRQLGKVAEDMACVRELGLLMPGYDLLTDAAIDPRQNDIPMSLDEWLLALDVDLNQSELGYVRQSLVSAYVAMYHCKPSTRLTYDGEVMGKKGKLIKGTPKRVCIYPPSALPLIESVLKTIGIKPIG